MPQLNYNGLDETWLLKTCGGVHWDLLHKDVDVFGEGGRFYASFFHIQIKFELDQSYYTESDTISIKTELFKYNDKIYRSVHTFDNAEVIMDTIFVRKGDEGSLIKYKPKQTESSCKEVLDIGISEHQDRKRRVLQEGVVFGKGNKLIFPPANLFNGVKILYCANYPYLVSLSEFVQHKKMFKPIKTLDISYYGNMTPDQFVYGKTKLVEKGPDSTETLLVVNDTPIAYCEIIR